VWIVEELLDEILGRIKFRDMEKKFNEKMTHEASEVKKEHDWAKTDRRGVVGVDRQMFLRGVGGNVETIISEKKVEGMKEMIDNEKNVNQKDIVIERKEKKFREYKTVGFNPIFKG